jgi:hypothetical protein
MILPLICLVVAAALGRRLENLRIEFKTLPFGGAGPPTICHLISPTRLSQNRTGIFRPVRVCSRRKIAD